MSVFQARHPFGPEPAAAAEFQEIRLLAGTVAAALLGIADVRDLLGGEAEPLGDLPVGQPHGLALALDLCEVQLTHRIARALLQVMAHAKDDLAEGSDHLVAHTDRFAGEAPRHLSPASWVGPTAPPPSAGSGRPPAPGWRSDKRACTRSTAQT